MTELTVKVLTQTGVKRIEPRDFERSVLLACAEWNRVMRGLVRFSQAAPNVAADVLIQMGANINRKKHPGRVAEHRLLPHGRSIVELDSRRWWRHTESPWWKMGNEIVPALLHELGHVLRLPHSSNREHIMCANYPDKNRISEDERELLRGKLKQLMEAKS